MTDLEKIVRDIVRDEVQKAIAAIPAPVEVAKWISLKECSERTGLSKQMLYKLTRNGQGIPSSKIAGKVVYEVSDVEKYMRDRKRIPTK